MKAKLTGAARGHNLLKKKADALAIRFRAILARIVEVTVLSFTCDNLLTTRKNKELMGLTLKEAYWTQVTAKNAAGDIA